MIPLRLQRAARAPEPWRVRAWPNTAHRLSPCLGSFPAQAAVAELEEARSAWEKVMENVCTQYQRLEEERMEYQRDVMWVAVNMGSAVAVQEDQVGRAGRRAPALVSFFVFRAREAPARSLPAAASALAGRASAWVADGQCS